MQVKSRHSNLKYGTAGLGGLHRLPNCAKIKIVWRFEYEMNRLTRETPSDELFFFMHEPQFHLVDSRRTPPYC